MAVHAPTTTEVTRAGAGGDSPPSSARSSRRSGRAYRNAPYAYIAPFFLLFGAFGLFPLLHTVWISFHEYRLGGSSPTFAGWDNYAWLFQSEAFYNSLWKTLTIGIISTVPQLLFALGLAHLLNFNMKVRAFFRISMIVPYATSLVAATLVFGSIFANTAGGLVNVVLGVLGLDPISWTTGNWTAQIAIAVIVTWHWTGYNALIYLAGMQSIPKDLYEAAAIDGASRFRQFLHVTIPGLRPTILFTIVLSTIGATQLFTEPFLFGNGAGGGALGQYQVLTLFMYETGFEVGRLGRAAAIACVTLIIVILLVLLNAGLAQLRTRDKGQPLLGRRSTASTRKAAR
ncbi:carbohydrate ABC transporter permease [uncultured Pseudokineococcus sp.]|uniref:carbohydrate ABC transporter permease n=1 Tax=uncultured Pseudokineococcus sp. TaxID=1642928 RepID=UPI002627F533|nr:sugar ABC transporter permease [uncultured Pseudokineococcus sp.]